YLIVGDHALDPATQWWFETQPVRVRYAGGVHEDEHPADSVRVGTVARRESLANVITELRDALGDQVFLQHWSAVTAIEAIGSSTHLLEAFHPRVNKWSMVERYCERKGIDASRVAAIGDGL